MIVRPLLNVTIKRKDLLSVTEIGKRKVAGIRTAGVAGLFGYYGNFLNFATGRMTWYATRRDRTVLLVTAANKKIILTPDEPAAFVAALLSER